MPSEDQIKRRLRALFERRDRTAVRLRQIDDEISAQTKQLCKATGVVFMRTEAVRTAVMQDEEAA